ncbi:hypothetical protein RJ640_006543 [Escallonia rubra]|uniref:F-box domain-containing protein n=1 Tax=Escallonia rubra TaxID=112253 RepID=A0AA88QVH2_9ASTE|nr:hypothetical protein RJ640_006543 [Escallonia rubra]
MELPPDVWAKILSKLGAVDVLESAEKVCTTWRKICKDPTVWKVIDMHNLGDLPYDLEVMTRHAIDRSQGQLVDINIEYFGSRRTTGVHRRSELGSSFPQPLLQFGSYLRDSYDREDGFSVFLTALVQALVTDTPENRTNVLCYDMAALIKAFKRLPLLEELRLTYTYMSEEAIEVAGRCCPNLKSFRYNQFGLKQLHIVSDDRAEAIARNMPDLCHLQLIGNALTNNGLQTILDKCPRLESLDLQKCFNISLEGDLERRCSELKLRI